MYPTLFEINGFTVTTFGLMMFLSFIVAAWILSKQLQLRDMNPEIAWDVLVWTALGGILGAKLYYIGLHWQDLVNDPVGTLTSRAGLVWYGGFIGGAIAYSWYSRRHGLPLARMFDATAPALALAYAVGRLGCFLVGDDYGVPTDSWVGIAFPKGSPPTTAGYFRTLGVDIPADVPNSAILAVHPTQLYEIAAALVMFAILWRVSSPRLRDGQLFGLYMILYGIERFAVEFVRAKGDRIVAGLSTSQIASILLVSFGAYLWTRRTAKRAEPAGAASSVPAAGGSKRR